MDYVLPGLAGVLLKFYDDYIDDEPYITNPYVTTTVQMFQVMVYTLVSQGDFWMSLVFAAFNGLAAFASWKEYSRPHVMSYFFLCPFLIALSIRNYTPLKLFDYAVIYGYLAFGLVEPRLFPEEVSILKFLARFGGAHTGFVSSYLYRNDWSPSILKLMLLSSGYSLMSSLSQMLKLTILQSPSLHQYASTPAPE